MNIRLAIKSKHFTFFTRPDAVAFTFVSTVELFTSSKPLKTASNDAHTARTDSDRAVHLVFERFLSKSFSERFRKLKIVFYGRKVVRQHGVTFRTAGKEDVELLQDVKKFLYHWAASQACSTTVLVL